MSGYDRAERHENPSTENKVISEKLRKTGFSEPGFHLSGKRFSFPQFKRYDLDIYWTRSPRRGLRAP